MRVDKELESLKEDLVKAVQESIRFKSVKSQQAEPGAPFGEGIREALDWVLVLGRNLGFTVKNVDGYAGHIEMGSGELLGILGHLDVVPEGDGWTVPPYSAVLKDGRIYGRGAMDDKGPTLAALFAMKAIKDAGIPLKKKVRLILGTDEESGWADMAYYFKKEEVPKLGFAPDAEFPVIHAEKGMLHVAVSKDYPTMRHILAISGGERANMVPDACQVTLEGISLTAVKGKLREFAFPNGVSAEIRKQEPLELVFHGVGAHGSLPQNGKNAVIYALRFLRSLSLSADENALLDWLLAHPCQGFSGEGFGITFEDEPSGRLSLNLGLLQMTSERLRFVIDIRYPVTFRREDVLAPITILATQGGYSVQVLQDYAPHYVPKDSELVQALLKAYADVTGLEPYAFAIGGGTYAKTMPQGVAFGPVLPGEPEVIHCPDEYITLDSLLLSARVYAQAILNLAQAE